MAGDGPNTRFYVLLPVIGTLLGTLLGGLITLATNQARYRQEELRHTRDLRFEAYSDHLAILGRVRGELEILDASSMDLARAFRADNPIGATDSLSRFQEHLEELLVWAEGFPESHFRLLLLGGGRGLDATNKMRDVFLATIVAVADFRDAASMVLEDPMSVGAQGVSVAKEAADLGAVIDQYTDTLSDYILVIRGEIGLPDQ